jgi:GNAT superfamily N-acetyltransferase
MPAASPLTIRPLEPRDDAQWLTLWFGYYTFYGLVPAQNVAVATWQRFFDPAEPVHCLVAERGGAVVGIAHYIFHRNTGVLNNVCYLQDLFTAPAARGSGVGRALVEAVYAAARAAGSDRVYWQTGHDNAPALALYNKLAPRLNVHVFRQELG